MKRLDQSIKKWAHWVPTWVWTGIFLIALSGQSYRLFTRVHVPGINDSQNQGFVDFDNAIYFPVICFLQGGNPYSRQYANEHPDGRSFPLFPTHSLIVHAPIGLFSINVARYVYFGFELVVFGSLLCWILSSVDVPVGLRTISILGSFVVLTVPFYSQLYLGQLTFQLVLASLVALHFSRNRPWLAGFALAIAACKPQFAIPIALLLLCRKDWKTVLIGGVIASVVSSIGILVICGNFGLANFFAELKANYLSLDSHPDVGTAIENYRRIDIYPLLARMSFVELPVWCKFAVPLTCLGLGGLAVFVIRKFPSLDSFSNLIICLTALGCIYHSIYDGLLLILPLVSIWLGRPKIWRKLPSLFRWSMFGILLSLVWNVFHLVRVQELFVGGGSADFRWRVATSLSSVAILVGLALCTAMSLLISKKLRASKK